jgi:PAS domain S-box-containing protein
MFIGNHDGHNLVEALIDSSYDAIVGVDLDGAVTIWNSSAESLFGYSSAEMIGRPVHVLIPPECSDEERSRWRRLLTTGGPELYTTTRLHKNGKPVSVAITATPITGPDSTVFGVAAITRRLSDPKPTDARFYALLEAATIALIGVGEDGLIKFANTEAERLFGYRPGELRNHCVEDLVPDQLRSIHTRHRRGYLAEPRTRRMGEGRALEGQRKDGSRFPAEVSLASIDDGGELLVAAAVVDITGRLQAESDRVRLTHELHTAQRLESLGHLAGGVAHNFNNLLAIISSNATLLREDVGEAATRDPDRWHEALDNLARLQRAAGRASVQAQQLLAFGRREVAKPVVFNLNGVLRDIERLLRHTLDASIAITVELTSEPCLVCADPGQFEQVVINLALNSRDAMPGGGTLHIASALVDLAGPEAAKRRLSAGRYVRLEVRDTGTGMTPEVAQRVFEPFFTTKDAGAAGGMGMAIVHGVVTETGGHIGVCSEPGVGTAITVLLPLGAKSGPVSPAEPSAAAASAPPRDKTVLVVDDEPDMRQACRLMLSRAGLQPLVAADGAEAIAIAQQHPGPIDVLLTDITMPGMNGAEVAERVSAIHPGIRVVFMSGYAQPFLTQQGQLPSGVNLVEKPFTKAALLDAITDTAPV